jgi:hypothetical protein
MTLPISIATLAWVAAQRVEMAHRRLPEVLREPQAVVPIWLVPAKERTIPAQRTVWAQAVRRTWAPVAEELSRVSGLIRQAMQLPEILVAQPKLQTMAALHMVWVRVVGLTWALVPALEHMKAAYLRERRAASPIFQPLPKLETIVSMPPVGGHLILLVVVMHHLEALTAGQWIMLPADQARHPMALSPLQLPVVIWAVRLIRAMTRAKTQHLMPAPIISLVPSPVMAAALLLTRLRPARALMVARMQMQNQALVLTMLNLLKPLTLCLSTVRQQHMTASRCMSFRPVIA